MARKARKGRNDLPQFAHRAKASRADLKTAQGSATKQATTGLTTTVRKHIRAAAPGGTVKGGRGGRPVKVGARYDLRMTGTGVRGVVRATGPMQLLEWPTKAHRQPKTLAAQKKRRARQLRAGFKARKTLKIPGIGYRRAVNHPGTKGKHPFGRGVEEFQAQLRAQRIWQAEIRRVIARRFGK